MNNPDDLKGWKELPATASEEAVGALLDLALGNLQRGQPVPPMVVPGLGEDGRQLVQAIAILHDCAAGVWENSSMKLSDPAHAPVSIMNPPGIEPPTLPWEGDVTDPMPDPFPGEFRFVRKVGEGAFGKVYLADDLNLACQVAIKTLKLPVTSTYGPQVLAALKREAQVLAKLDHPNIVRVHAWREAGGEAFIVQQYVAGGSLAGRLSRETALLWADAARYVADVGDALVEAHARGVIHRDIKPDNILYHQEKDEAILTDFGISARLAEPGAAAGTPLYMAPEGFEGSISAALDVYSLAATLYRLVTGRFPFSATSRAGLLDQKRQGLPDPDPNCAVMPELLEKVIRAGLAPDPSQRPSLTGFLATLRAGLNQSLADALVPPEDGKAAPPSVNLRVVVSRQRTDGSFEPVAVAKPPCTPPSRDMKKVPRLPDQVALHTGDRVRIETVADRTGYVTVFNIGPTGNLNRLYPEDNAAPAAPVEAHRTLQISDVEMTPPVGRDRVVAVWSRKPLPMKLEELRSLAEHGTIAGSRSYHSSRDMKRLQKSVAQLVPDNWHAVVLELAHIA